MNKVRRQKLSEALEMIGQAIAIIEECKEEEEDSFESLPDGIRDSEKGETMEQYIMDMEDAISEAESAAGSLEEVFE